MVWIQTAQFAVARRGFGVIFIAVDPGLTGAIAAIDESREVRLAESLPIIRHGSLAWIDAPALDALLAPLSADRVAGVWLERAQASPQMGRSSAFNYGVGFGSLLATIQLRGWRLEFVAPSAWKRHFGLGPDKSASLDEARLRFPSVRLDRTKDHGLAEALLLADYVSRPASVAVTFADARPA
jgi:hypothetical protein